MRIRAAIPLAVSALLSLSSVVQAKVICTVLADAGGKILIEEGACGQRVTPASTFKIALSLMGYDSG
jgi:beta-lactamase class D